MRKNKTLVNAPVVEDFLSGENNERIEFLKLPDNPAEYSLDEDIRKGAVQFTELMKLLNRKRISRVITMTSGTVEMGLIAVTYAAMEMYRRSEDNWNPDDDEIYCDGWTDSVRNVPIIQFSDIISYMSRDNESFSDRGFMMAQEQAVKKHIPYWERCRRNPVCVVVRPNFANPWYIDYLNMFSGNRN